MDKNNELSTVESVNAVINKELTKETANALLATTFKGLTAPLMKQALLEGMLRGFTFKDFIEKNIYAIKFGDGYTLIVSIDHARKIGMRSGVVGVEKPEFEMDEKKIVSCTVTIKRKIDAYVGDFTATAYFEEYYKSGYNGKPSLWDTKPRTMLSKVAEMHALRKACPEELAQSYVEEEMQKEAFIKEAVVEIDIEEYRAKMQGAKTLAVLQKVWADMPLPAKQQLKELKDELIIFIENENNNIPD